MCRRCRRSVGDRRIRQLAAMRSRLKRSSSSTCQLLPLRIAWRLSSRSSIELVDRSLRPLQEFAGLFAVWLGHDAHSRSGGSANSLSGTDAYGRAFGRRYLIRRHIRRNCKAASTGSRRGLPYPKFRKPTMSNPKLNTAIAPVPTITSRAAFHPARPRFCCRTANRMRRMKRTGPIRTIIQVFPITRGAGRPIRIVLFARSTSILDPHATKEDLVARSACQNLRCHSPRRRGIQYAAASRLITKVSEYWIARLRGR